MKFKYINTNFFGSPRRYKLFQVKLNGKEYWIRKFQLQLIEKDLEYMQRVNT